MDINKTIGELNNAPDAYLDQVVSGKGPMSPFALVVQSQRQQMRNGAAPQGQGQAPTVAQQVIQQRAGLAGLPQQPPMEQQNPMQQGLGAQHLARGGVVGYDGGGTVAYKAARDQKNNAASTVQDLESSMQARAEDAATKAGLHGVDKARYMDTFVVQQQQSDPAYQAAAAALAQSSAAERKFYQPNYTATPATPATPPSAKGLASVQTGSPPMPNGGTGKAFKVVNQGDEISPESMDFIRRDAAANGDPNLPITLNFKAPPAAQSSGSSATSAATSADQPKGIVAIPTTATPAQAPSELDQKNQATLLNLANQTIPDLTDEQAAAKVKARRDLYGIPALIQGQTDNATRFQDSQDAAVAAKRAVVDKANSSGEGTRAMLNGMLQAIDARKPNQRANLMGGAATGYEGFRNASLARAADQVNQEDTQRKQRFDMEQQLQNARILYAQGNEAEASNLVQAVVARQDALRKAQESAAVQGATNASNERSAAATNKTNIGIHAANNETSRYVADTNYEKGVDSATVRAGLAGNKDPNLIAAAKAAFDKVKELTNEKIKAGLMLQGPALVDWQQRKAVADADYLKYQQLLTPQTGDVAPTQTPIKAMPAGVTVTKVGQ
jgi:hypothetical protein